MAGAFGVQAQFGIGASSTVDKPLDLLSDGVRLTSEIVDGNGMKGTRSRSATRAREGRKRVGGSIGLNPTAVEWSNLLQYILGGTPASTSYTLADALPTFYYTADR